MELVANFELSEGQEFDALFEINASGTTWGSIDGDIGNQTDLKNALDTKASNERVDSIVDAFDEDIENINSDITSIKTTINSYGDIVTYDAANFATAAQGEKANTAIQPNNNITLLNNNAGYITSADLPLLEDLTTTAQLNAINSGATTSKIGQIATNTSNISSLTTTVTNNYNTLDGRITSEVSALNTALGTEITNRQNADNNLQSQIDAITASSDVTDIVGTYAQLQAYDTTGLANNSIIKVLQDESRNDETTYYRWVITASVGSWVLIGEEGPYYTKSEADSTFVPQTRTINNKALNQNINLTASDVGALSDTTTIPTKTSDLTNDSGFITSSALSGYATKTWVGNQGYITGITSTDVTTALGYTPYNSTNPNGYTSNIGTVTSVNNTQPDVNGNVTITIPDTATWGNITGTLSNQTDLQNALNAKQDELTAANAGTDIEIINRTQGGPLISFTNDTGYTTNIGTVTSVNNTLPDNSGNVTLNIPTPTVDQTFDGTSTNAQSGVAIDEKLTNYQYKLSSANAGTDISIVEPTSTQTVTGTGSISLPDAVANSLSTITISGLCSQTGTPTPTSPIDIVCNNGTLKVNSQGQVYIDGTTETLKDSLNNTATAEMLLSAGTFIDTQEILTGAITKRLAIRVFDGTESWSYQSIYSRFVCDLENIDSSLGVRRTPMFCTHYNVIDDGRAIANIPNLSIYGALSTSIYIKDETYNSAADFQSWLASQYANGTPVILVYPLGTAVISSVTAQTLNTKNGSNTIEITKSSLQGLGISATYTKTDDVVINFTNNTGYTTNIGTVTSVNNEQPDANGNVTISTSVDIDNSTITKNGSNQLQTVAVKDNRSGNAVKTWTGTRSQYDAIVNKDSNTLYNITDDTDVTLSLLNLVYPIGSIYIGTMATCPLATLGVGTWQLVASDRVLQGAGTNSVGTTVEAGLPNMTGQLSTPLMGRDVYTATGVFSNSAHTSNLLAVPTGSNQGTADVDFDASRSNDIYGSSTTVQPPAYIVNIWERTA